jgi:hypothetical protein
MQNAGDRRQNTAHKGTAGIRESGTQEAGHQNSRLSEDRTEYARSNIECSMSKVKRHVKLGNIVACLPFSPWLRGFVALKQFEKTKPICILTAENAEVAE